MHQNPIPIYCKEVPSWREDMGIRRDPVRLLFRAAAHLDMYSADLLMSLKPYEEIEKELIENSRASLQLFLIGEGLRLGSEDRVKLALAHSYYNPGGKHG